MTDGGQKTEDEQANDSEQPTTTRRVFVVAALGSVLSAACGSSDSNSNTASGGSGGAATGGGGTSSGGGGTSSGGGGTGGATCTVYPQQTEGPFYLNDDLVRSDIREGRPGTEFVLTITVQSGASCAPLKNVAVDIWQCDAGGVYSGFPNQLGGLDTTGQTFLRGTQITGDDGSVEFIAIYPGWYPGRTTHIHFKVHTTATSEAVSQLYFPEETTTEVYNTPPYDARGQKDTTNDGDGVTAGGIPPLLQVTKTATGYAAQLTVTVA